MAKDEDYLDVVTVSGLPAQEDEFSCPLWDTLGCKHFKNKRECKYGLTDVRVPPWCPLPLTIKIKRERHKKEDVYNG